MADPSSGIAQTAEITLNFEPIKDEERSVLSSDTQVDILAFFETAMNSWPNLNIDDKAERFVQDLVAYAPKETSGASPTHIASCTWIVLINASACIPCRHHGQDVLVKIVRLLNSAGDTWKDYPEFAMETREHWNDSPIFQPDVESDQAFSLDEWLNVNSFMARLGRLTITLGLWELRNGLEGMEDEEILVAENITNTRILVATEWIIQGAGGLLRYSLQNALLHHVSTGRPWDGGPLFLGTKGFNLERWGFWKRRFGELRGTARESTQERIDEAVKVIIATEADAANAWAVVY